MNKPDSNSIEGPSNAKTTHEDPLESLGVSIDLGAVLLYFWTLRFWILLIVLCTTVAATIYAINLPKVYKAEALLVGVDDSRSSTGGAFGGQLGSLATLAGVNLRSSGSNNVALGIETLQSTKFLSNFIVKYDMKVPLIAGKAWEFENDELIIDRSVYDAASQKWGKKYQSRGQVVPSDLRAVEVLKEKLFVTQDNETGFIQVGLLHPSPTLAKRWVDLLVIEINEEMKKQAIFQADRSMDFLTKQMSETAVAEIKVIFHQLIEEQLKNRMLAEARPEYLFRTVDPPVVAERPHSPNVVFIIGTGFLMGGFLSIIFGSIFYVTKHKRKVQ